MVKPALRAKSISTKVTEAEYAQLEALAAGRSMSEWTRDVLLATAERAHAAQADQALMAEMLALRTILVNLLFKLARGASMTADEMKQLIERADADKDNKASERLKRRRQPGHVSSGAAEAADARQI